MPMLPLTTVSLVHGKSVVTPDQEVRDDISIEREHNYSRALAAISAEFWNKSGAPESLSLTHGSLGILNSRC